MRREVIIYLLSVFWHDLTKFSLDEKLVVVAISNYYSTAVIKNIQHTPSACRLLGPGCQHSPQSTGYIILPVRRYYVVGAHPIASAVCSSRVPRDTSQLLQEILDSYSTHPTNDTPPKRQRHLILLKPVLRTTEPCAAVTHVGE
jgi:hypothetical protein